MISKTARFAAIAALLTVTGCSHEYVDLAPARAVADGYYRALKENDERAAKAQFSVAFKQQTGQWPRLIHLMQEQGGPVVSSELESATLAAHEHEPCYVLSYGVSRVQPGTQTEETMLVCRAPKPDRSWAIAGHAIKRLDNGKTIRAGMLPAELGAQP